MSADANFDRWHALRHLRILVSPKHRLETFGNTLVNYHYISVLDDHPGKIRIREGRLEAHQPLVITPHFAEIETEGVGEVAKAYLEFLRETEKNLRILQYGLQFKTDNFSEQIVTDSLAAVVERVKLDVAARHDDFSAVLQGVDDPWDIALVELWRREVDRSAGENIRELNEKGGLFG